MAAGYDSGTMSTVSTLAERIDALLPQTQCTKCGYQGCKPYADAIVAGEADIDQCPPGGNEGVEKLAQLLGRTTKPLNPEFGEYRPPAVAVIDESTCIGCARCLPPCPTDAIVGANKWMHTVVLDLCTGCELCIPVCPVDCISMVPVAALPDADASRQRYITHQIRLTRDREEREARLAATEAQALARLRGQQDTS
jgi:Na+-translocating ferredoxin:NAD+ oxidoreductase subunit B